MTAAITGVKIVSVKGVELSSKGLVRGVKAVVEVEVTRKEGKPELQELRGTYKFYPNPHESSAYNDRSKSKFYHDAAESVAWRVLGPRHALVGLNRFQFEFGGVTYRATGWDEPIGGNYKNRWRVDGPEVPPP
ncbi:hypothetical protein ACFXGA_08575 [Actinosynnema sp. NPDC059335]|uniref:hypothetical protein n=1 Tax=Actinosynnema sp. NPDC059335 TaxID=3346804 RepID=UPI00366EEA80